MISNKTYTLIVESMPLIMRGAVMTLKIAVCAILIGFVCGLLAGIFTSKKVRIPYVAPIIHFYVLLIRGTPLYLQILITYFALPEIIGINLSPFFAGVLALGMNSTAYVAEIVRGGINSIPDDQWAAGYVLGYPTRTLLSAIILPQMFAVILPALTNELVVLIKETSILSMIGVLEMTRVGMNISAKTLDPLTIYGIIALIYFAITSALSVLAKRLERRLSYGSR